MAKANPQQVNLRTTIVPALARTLVDESRRGSDLDRTTAGSDSSNGSPSSEPPEVPLPEVGDVVGGHYKLVRLLGQGMFGRVYVAQRLDVPEHQVALKLLPRQMYVGRNIERELVMLATVGHPHVVQLKDHGATRDYVWLTMPVYEGGTLAERLIEGPLSLKEAYDIFLAVARGLQALHEAGLRHQDVKPENIYLAHFGGLVHPILLDLGVAAELEAPFVAGTALYASPEQLGALHGYPGAYELNEKMDTYCLGATLLMAIVGPRYFAGETAKSRDELAESQETRAEDPIPEGALPELTGKARDLLTQAFRRWLAFEPSDRPAMSLMAEQLDVLLEQERQRARAETEKRARQKQQLLRFRIAVGAFLLLGIAGGALVFSKRETLAMANALNEAKKLGDQSFKDLGQCNASNLVAKDRAEKCDVGRKKERTEFYASLENVKRTGTAAEQERARQIEEYATKTKALEETLVAERRKAGEEKKLAADEKESLTAERDHEHAIAEQRFADLTAMQAERDSCRTDKNACVEERDQCRALKPPTSPGTKIPPLAGTPPDPLAPSPAIPAPVPAAPGPSPYEDP